MRIRLIAIGGKMPAWVTTGYEEYARRLPGEMSLELVELPLGHRGKGADLARAIRREGEQMLQAIPATDRVVALDLGGRSWSTEQLAVQMEGWRQDGRNLSLLVGGPDGLAPECLARADQRWCLSPLTLPHPMVRILVAEQLYRAWTVLQGHPYHK